jgi:chromodomain-helicase-DNA-binding protein 4
MERWAPRLRVVPFFGDSRARNCIIEYELTHFHVVVASYEAFSQGQDFNRVFKKQPRWEVLVVDEGQRLKNNESLTFKKLNELNSIHRVIMTGVSLPLKFISRIPHGSLVSDTVEQQYSGTVQPHELFRP